MKVEYSFKLGKLTEEAAKETCTWKYESPYEVYSSWSWEEMIEKGEPMTNPLERDKNFLGLYDQNHQILGFAGFSYPKENTTRIGLGLKPDICGKGIGEYFVNLIINESKKRCSSGNIDLEVLTWNKRAYKVYRKCGFKTVETYIRKTPTGNSKFHRMEYKL
ncbi:GNAT family N-acetyltransferase [Sporosalibacterium faouarense]|uniref:GNAT family N-acetyltransferase n=1 Tax=Sporosalibacterium faouarense TaxID=516123 RepID=UPI00192C4447|nr:GNAT family N-acetyltransferase [Sporosalibacterium faouarense]